MRTPTLKETTGPMLRHPRVLRLAAPIVLVAIVAAACSSSKSSSSSSSSSSSAAAPTTTAGPKVTGTLNGSGSTFQAAYDQQVISDFQAANPGATVNYQAKGSGAGQTDLKNQVVDFAGSDVTIAATDLPGYKGGPVLYFPIAAGPITVSYNLSGVTALQLSAPTIAKIFARTVKTWNDATIAADNPGITLPNTPITVVHRSDSSGTTANFTAYLTVADPADWTLGKGKTVKWSADTQAGNGNAGVAQSIKSTSGAIGYVDYSDAKAGGLSWAKIKNASGAYVDATLDAASASVAAATVNADLTYNPINTTGAAAYPITSPTYMITYAKYTDAAKVALLKGFLSFVLGSAGQADAKTTNFAALPSALDIQALAQVDKITVG
ncbi:MAG: phosphate ABC transporter substrate-binding protein PstS [Acidimicrobiales bacterium]